MSAALTVPAGAGLIDVRGLSLAELVAVDAGSGSVLDESLRRVVAAAEQVDPDRRVSAFNSAV